MMNITESDQKVLPQVLTKFLPLVEGCEQVNEDGLWHEKLLTDKVNFFSVNHHGEITGIVFANKTNINCELLSQCNSLKSLSIKNTPLDRFPNEILALTKLENLEISSCGLSVIPKNITQLSKLTQLTLSDSKIDKIPDALSELINLEQLVLDDNQINELSINLIKLQGLCFLSLDNNLLTKLPESIGQLSKLEFLLVSNNEIDTLPSSIGDLSLLNYLSVGNNRLTYLPNSFGNLHQLKHLQLANNFLSELPSSLCELTLLIAINISNNKIKNIPETLVELALLKHLNIEGNPLPFPDPSFHDLNAQEQIQTLLAIQNSPLKPLKQAKILVVGDERVGKTSVINRLLGKLHNDNQTSTQGIDISELAFDGFKSNIWDFAGQELTHQTHQFFLTERSLYVYVLDAQKEDNQSRDLHWLNTIKSYSDNSPIIIVVNHCDQNLNYKFDLLRYQENYQIVDVIYTSACNLNTLESKARNQLGDSIPKLVKAIEMQLPKLAGIERELPESWHRVKASMENYKQSHNVIEKDTYEKECINEGVVGKPLQTALLKILNSIGTIVAFPNDFRLQLTQILNPEWVTNAVYKIVRTPSDKPGIYSEQVIGDILNDDYTALHQQWLIDLLIKFELGFRLPENNDLLIPTRLPSVMPEYSKSKYQKGLNIRFNYHNRGLLKLNTLPQLIVRLHHYVDEDTSKYWRHGIFLRWKDCYGVIVADESKQVVEVFLTEKNENALTLLQWIRSNLEKIEESQTKANKDSLPYIEEIALFDESCEKIIGHVKHDKIQRAHKKGKMKIELEILDPETNEEDDREFDVSQLLGLYKRNQRKFEIEKFPQFLVHSLLSLTEVRAKAINYQEDDINDLLGISLKGGGYGVSDQNRGGFSGSGKSAGERDIVVLNEYGREACIIEAMCLSSVVKKTIQTHYDKLTDNYSTYGNPVDFLVTYAKVKNFGNFWKRYQTHFDGIHDITKQYTDKFNVHVGATTVDIDGSDEGRKIIHILVNFGVKP